MNTVRAFVEARAGSRFKQVYDELTFEPLDRHELPAAYPYPYGFLPDHMGPDGECVDCYLLTTASPPAGSLVEGRVVGLIEQWEAGAEDHKVLLLPADQPAPEADPDPEVCAAIMAFMRELFASFPDMLVTVGPVRGRRAALQYLSAFGTPPR